MAQLNSSILQPTQGIKPTLPTDRYARMLQLRGAILGDQENQMKLQAGQQDVAKRAAIQKAVMDAGGDVRKALPQIDAIDVNVGLKLREAFSKQDLEASQVKENQAQTDQAVATAAKTTAETKSAADKAQRDAFFNALNVASTAPEAARANAYSRARTLGTALGYNLPEAFDRPTTEGLLRSRLTPEQMVAQQNANTTAARLEFDKGKTATDNSLNETELALMVAKGDPQAKVAWDLIKELKAKEKAAGAEPGTYITLTDPQGKITGFVNPKTQKYIKPEDISGMPSDSQRGPTSPERQKMQENAKSGLRAIATLREELKKPGTLAALAVPNSPTARKARAARAEMVDVMTRLRTGAALNRDEQTFYRDQAPGLIDALFNDPGTIDYKLSIFEDEFNGLAGTSARQPATSAPAGNKGKADPLGIR